MVSIPKMALGGTMPLAAAQVISVTSIPLRVSWRLRISARTRRTISIVWLAVTRAERSLVNGCTAISSKYLLAPLRYMARTPSHWW